MHKFFGTLLKYLTAAILIFIPLYPKFPLFFLPGSTVAVRAEDFLIALTAVILVLHFFTDKKKLMTKLAGLPAGRQVLIYLLIGLVSAVSAILITKNVNAPIVILHLLRRLEYLFVFYFIYYVGSQSWLNRRFLFELVLLPVVGVFFYGLAQIYARAPVISTMNPEFAKGVALTLQPGVQLSSTFAGHYDLAIYLAIILAYLATILTFTKNKLGQIGLAISFIILLWLFTQAGSRIALFGLTFSIVTVCVSRKRFKLGLVLVTLVGLSILTSPNLMMRIGNLFRVVTTKFQSAVIAPTVYAVDNLGDVLAATALRPIEADRSTSIRFDVEWPRALRSFAKNPFLGTGYSSISLATDNEYLRALGETGLLGFLALISILISLGRILIRRFRSAKGNLDKIITLGALGCFSVFIISAVFLDVFEASKIAILFWAFTGLAVSTKS